MQAEGNRDCVCAIYQVLIKRENICGHAVIGKESTAQWCDELLLPPHSVLFLLYCSDFPVITGFFLLMNDIHFIHLVMFNVNIIHQLLFFSRLQSA